MPVTDPDLSTLALPAEIHPPADKIPASFQQLNRRHKTPESQKASPAGEAS